MDWGIPRDFGIYDTIDQLNQVKSSMARLQLDTAQWKTRAVASSINNAKNKLIRPEAFASTASGYYNRAVAQIYTKYESLLKANNALVLMTLVEVCGSLRNILMFLRCIRINLSLLLVDEYQDTNYTSIPLLTSGRVNIENICVTGDRTSLFMAGVGRKYQSIMDFEGLSRCKGGAVRTKLPLYETHPSYGYQRHSSQNKYRKQKNLWTENIFR